jgi:multidrug efflux pump subunit AcrB
VLAAQNIQIPSGNLEYQDNKLTVNIPGNFSSIDDIRNTIISVSKDNGNVTKIGDIADVAMAIQDGVQKFKENGKNAVLITGYFENNKNVVIIGKDVRKAIDEVKSGLPKDLVVDEVIYQPDAVSSSTNEFMLHLVIGIVLVMLVVFFGMGVRNALVVSTAIPLSILATFIVMYLNNVQIHQMSLTALIIALGILVDNAIVVCDTIQVRLNQGDSCIDAAYNGTTRCTIPIFSATVAIIVAFSPLLGIPGVAGQFMSAIPWVLIVSVIASYIVAMFIVPAMMAYVAKKEKKEHEQKESKIRLFFKRALVICLKFKKITVTIMIVCFAFTIIVLMPNLPSQFFPYVDKDFFYIEINSEKVANLDATEKLADDVEALLTKQPEVKNCTVSIGNGMPKFYITMEPPKPSDDYAQMVVKFDLKKTKRFKDNVEFASYVQTLLNQNISGGKCKVKLLEYANPTDAKVILRVTGKDLARLVEVSTLLKDEISKIPGTSDVRNNWNDSTLQMEVKLDEDKASSLGITKYDVQKEINMALYGYKASVYRKDGNEYAIKVKSDINNANLLENFKIKSTITGEKIPLKEFAAIDCGTKLDTINTYKREQAVEVLADPLPGYNASNIENQIETQILPKIDYTGTNVSFAGEREDVKENFTILGILAVVAVFMIYVILMLQFKSFIQPIVILLTIPLSLIGSVTGLFVLNQPLSLTAFLGIIALIGLVVKNGILLIDYINDARNNGCTIDEACIDAVEKRFNAIILSALTVILALIPLALSGSSLFSPMAISLMSGLAVSTFLTMVVIPVVYSIIETAMLRKKEGEKK